MISGWCAKKAGELANIIRIFVVLKMAMMNELLKIQQDMGAPQQQKSRQQAAVLDDGEAEISADPNDWLADLPKFGMYHRGYTTNHWLQVFRPL